MLQLHFEDALNFLIGKLARVPETRQGRANERKRLAGGSDIWIDAVSKEYWGAQGKSLEGMSQDDKEPYCAAFYDSAWELSRRGILRPAAAVPDGQEAPHSMGTRFNAVPFFGDSYSLTAWGRQWVKVAVAERAIMPSSAARITEVLYQFTPRFGQGYAQRAAEAVASWQTGNYLAACTMAGAAAESILLAAAIKKSGSEAAVLSEYRSSTGRSRVTRRLRGDTTNYVGDQFEHALGILSYWRDNAGHGAATSIGEIEAYEAISRLLRLARFTSDNWRALTV